MYIVMNMIVCTWLNLPVLCTITQLIKVFVIWSVVIRLDFLAQAILFDEYKESMIIVNGNAKIYIYYHYYWFSNVQRSILKRYIIAIWMEIIFCRCGGAEVILMVSHHQYCTENGGSAKRGVEVPTSGSNNMVNTFLKHFTQVWFWKTEFEMNVETIVMKWPNNINHLLFLDLRCTLPSRPNAV